MSEFKCDLVKQPTGLVMKLGAQFNLSGIQV